MAESHLNLAVSTSSYLLKYLNIFPLGSVSMGTNFSNMPMVQYHESLRINNSVRVF